MNAHATIESGSTTNTASNSIAIIVAQNPAVVLVDAKSRDDLFAHIQREIDAFEPDTSTAKGRDAIKSFAFKITRTKTAIDDAGKKLNEEARAKINLVDAARRDAREHLAALAEEVRRPLTEWEDAEADRVEGCRGVIADLKAQAFVSMGDTAEMIAKRLADVEQSELAPDRFREMLPEAEQARDDAIRALTAALERAQKEEADRAELERLRKEAEALAEEQRVLAERERQRIEAERAKEEAQRQAQLAEERRVRAAEEEKARIAAAEKAAADRAQRDAERKAQEEREAIERRHRDELAKAQREAAEAEARRQAEADRIEREEAARQAEAKRLADEEARRQRNRAHKSKVQGEVKAALMGLGLDEETARAVVVAIVGGKVPHTSVAF